MKRIAIVITNIVSYFSFVFYVIMEKCAVICQLFYGQMIKRTFSYPHPKVLFAVKPVHIAGHKYINIGEYGKIGQYATITAWYFEKKRGGAPIISIGNNVVIGSFDHITACNSIIIEDDVLLGKYVTITDNSHGKNTSDELQIPPLKRELFSKGSVVIKKNVWIGDKVSILPGVTIGEGAIIGANSVVTHNVPPFSIACGNPAKVIKLIAND